jgi:hypothetical protein
MHESVINFKDAIQIHLFTFLLYLLNICWYRISSFPDYTMHENKPDKIHRSNVLKKIFIFILIIGIIGIGSFFYLKYRKSTDFEPLIKAKLQQLVKDGSNGLYNLEIGKIEIDVLNSRATVHNVKLLIDSARLKVLDAAGTSPVDAYTISLSDIVIDGFNVDDVLTKKNINLDVLNIKDPDVEIYHPVNKNNQFSKDTSTLYSRIAKSLGHFYIKHLVISNMNFVYHNIAHQEKLTAFKNISMKFNDLEIDSLTQFDTTRFLYAKDAAIYLNNYSIRTPDSLYFIRADSLTLHAAQRNLDVINLSLEPRGNKTEFSKKLKTYKDRYDIKFKKASFKNIDWYHLFLSEGFTAQYGELKDGEMEIYVNRNIPPSGKSKVGNYPHQLLMKLDFPVEVDTLRINNFKLTYLELNPKIQKTGRLVFDKIKGDVTNITNIRENIAVNKIMQVKASTSLMNEGDLDAVFTFDLTKTNNGNFSVDVSLGPVNGTVFNPVAIPLGPFEIKSLSIKKLKAHIDGTNNNAHSIVFFSYNDLKITALKPDEDKKLKSRKFLSFIANTFIINKSNNSVKETSTPSLGNFTRDPSRSFFALIWRALLDGIIKIVS